MNSFFYEAKSKRKDFFSFWGVGGGVARVNDFFYDSKSKIKIFFFRG